MFINKNVSHEASYRIISVFFAPRQNSGDDVFENRYRSQKTERKPKHLKEPEFVEIPDI